MHSYTTGEPAFVVCPPVCHKQHTAKARFAVCPAHTHNKRQAHSIPGLCRVLHTANTRHTANLNLYREQHTAKTGYTAKANLTLTSNPSRQHLPCAAARHTTKPGFAVCLRLAHGKHKLYRVPGCSTRQTICFFRFCPLIFLFCTHSPFVTPYSNFIKFETCLLYFCN